MTECTSIRTYFATEGTIITGVERIQTGGIYSCQSTHGISNFVIASDHDDVSAVNISNSLQGDIADLTQNNSAANQELASIQQLISTAESIEAKLARMASLAEMSSTGLSTDSEKKQMQDEFETLATEINQAAENTTYKSNKNIHYSSSYVEVDLFASSGIAIGIPIDDRDVIVGSKDLTVDISGLNIVSNPDPAAEAVKRKFSDVSDYVSILRKKGDLIEERMRSYVRDYSNILGVKSEDLKSDVTELKIGIQRVFSEAQIENTVYENISPERVSALLDYLEEYISADEDR